MEDAARTVTGNGARHVSPNHPALQRAAVAPAMVTELSRPEISNYNDRLDHIALLLAQLPDQPLTVAQRERMRIIAREMLRRAGVASR